MRVQVRKRKVVEANLREEVEELKAKLSSKFAANLVAKQSVVDEHKEKDKATIIRA
jgi:hypothetical protein